MIKKIYINNFRSFQNFTIDFEQNRSALILGRNGSGKSNLFRVIQILKNIGDGEGSIVNLVSKGDFSYGDTSKPMRFEFDVLITEVLYKYTIVFEFPVNFKEARIKEEMLVANGVLVLSRQEAQIEYKTNDKTLEFLTDWHKVALPIIQTRSEEDAVAIFKNWISKMIVLSPIPQFMDGESRVNDTKIEYDASNVGSWAKSIFSQSPKSYIYISKYLSNFMAYLDEIENRPVAENTNKLIFHFKKNAAKFSIDFEQFSNGEKIFFLASLLISVNKIGECNFCMWDEPDNFISVVEIENFIFDLRRSFEKNGQFLATTHNPETIKCFSDSSTYILSRDDHLEPTRIDTAEKMDEYDKSLGVVKSITMGFLEF